MSLAMGFHYSIGGNKTGSGAFIDRLNAAGIPVMMKGASDAGLCFEAQEKGKLYGVENILIWRATSDREDRADYWLAPSVAAAKKWGEIQNLWPPELDKNLVWWEVINEPRKIDAPDETQPTWGNMHTTAWLGLFMVEMAKLMIPSGHKLCGPSFSSGEPEPEDWQLEGMASWLRYCAENPTQAAISHHEYCYPGLVPFEENYPWHFGRFQSIIAAADKLGISRTFSIFITEFGWQERNVPSFETAVPVLTEYMKLGVKFPQLKGVALWTLQSGWGDISNQLAAWISNDGNPLANWVIENQYPELPQPQPTAVEFGATLPEDDMEPKECDLYLDLGRFVHLLPQNTTDDEIATIARQFNAAKNSFVYSHDDAELIVAHGRGENPDGKKVSEVRIWEPERFTDDVIDYFASRGYKYSIGYFDGNPPPMANINLKYRPCQTQFISQVFGANPQNYPLTPGHEGLDYAVVKDASFYAVADGAVIHASNLRWSSNTLSDYGWHVVLDHGDYCTVYAHARPDLPVAVGQNVTAGQIVGYSGNTGNSTGYHLHFTLLDKTGTVDPNNGYPVWKFGRPVNPWPFVEGKPAPVLPQPVLIDVAPYFVPDGQYGRKIVIKTGSGTQPMQLEKRPSDVILRKGDGNWIDGVRYQDSEQWRVKDGQIQKGIDTSDAGNGGKDGYDLGWAEWIPQFVEIGKTYHSTPIVKRFDRTNNCQVYSESQANDYLTIKAIIPMWISPANSDIVLNDVLVIEWRSGTSDLSVPPNEVYYFAKNISYVGWGSHFIVEIADGQAPLTGTLDCGL